MADIPASWPSIYDNPLNYYCCDGVRDVSGRTFLNLSHKCAINYLRKREALSRVDLDNSISRLTLRTFSVRLLNIFPAEASCRGKVTTAKHFSSILSALSGGLFRISSGLDRTRGGAIEKRVTSAHAGARAPFTYALKPKGRHLIETIFRGDSKKTSFQVHARENRSDSEWKPEFHKKKELVEVSQRTPFRAGGINLTNGV